MPYADPDRQRQFDAAKHRAAYARKVGRPVRPRAGWTSVPSYNVTHRRLRKLRGPASAQWCAECGATAHHWSYDHSDPEQVIGDTGDGVIVAYSLDFARYRALCRSCHAKDDRRDVSLRREIEQLRLALLLVAHWAATR